MKSKVFKYLYGLFCFVPALAVFSTCAYVALNENAKDNYSSINDTSIQLVSTPIEDFVTGNTYVFDFDIISTSPTYVGATDYYISNVSINGTANPSIDVARFYADSSNNFFLQLRNSSSNTAITSYNLITAPVNVLFTYSGRNNNNYITFLSNYSFSRYINFSSTLDNVFYYATYQVENNGFFSWVKGNFLYTGMNDFCSIFNAENTFVSFYLTYVLTISLCYLAFEVLMLFINMARNLINSLQSKEW